MFSQPLDNSLWHLIAYSAGTGGSVLIIGSAAGVVAMGMEKIEFFWYLKKNRLACIYWICCRIYIFYTYGIIYLNLKDWSIKKLKNGY
jgi:Na+/H+ antiporter NhaD/arsenite permease-like protein